MSLSLLLPKRHKWPSPSVSPQREKDVGGRADQTTHLVDDIDTIVQLLSLQEGVKMFEQVHQVFLSVPVRNEDGNPL